jgi:hypothetical protein
MRVPDGYTLADSDRVARFVAVSPDRIRRDMDVTGIEAAGEVVCAISSSWDHVLFGRGGERVLRRGVTALFAVLEANPRDVTITQRALGTGGRHDARLAVLDRLFAQHAPPGAVRPRFARVLDLSELSDPARTNTAGILEHKFTVEIDGEIALAQHHVANPVALAEVIAECTRAGVRWLEIDASPAYAHFGGELVRLPNFTITAEPAIKSRSWLQRVTAR